MDDLQRRAYENPMRNADGPFPPGQVQRHGRASVALTANF